MTGGWYFILLSEGGMFCDKKVIFYFIFWKMGGGYSSSACYSTVVCLVDYINIPLFNIKLKCFKV